MKKLKFTLAIALLMIMITVAGAQITITSNDVYGAGYTYTSYSPTEAFEINHGNAGGGQTWTIPEYEVMEDAVVVSVDPATTTWSNDFPTATHCLTVGGEGFESFSYQRIAPDGVYLLGFASGVLGSIVYEEEDFVVPLPASYQSNWTSVLSFSSSPTPGVTITTTDSSVNVIDAWGTVNTQFGSFQVLRIKSHSYDKSIVEFPPLPPTITETSSWDYEYVTQHGTPVLSMFSFPDETNENFTEGTLTLGSEGAQAADPVRGPVAESFRLGQNYPNPFNPTTSLPVSIEQTTQVEIKIYNELGELVKQESHLLTPGQHSLPINGSKWASGNYFAQVKAGDQLQTKRMTLVK